MKKTLTTIIVLLLLLCGCTNPFAKKDKKEDLMLWNEVIEKLKNQTNYAVEEKTFTYAKDGKTNAKTSSTNYQFDKNKTLITIETYPVYYEKQDNNCYTFVVDEIGQWQKSPVQYSDDYFCASTLINRLNKLSGYIDEGSLKYNSSKLCFEGDGFKGTYVYMNEEHKPSKIIVALDKNKNIISFYEESEVNDNINTLNEISSVVIGGYNEISVDLPNENSNYYAQAFEKLSKMQEQLAAVDSLENTLVKLNKISKDFSSLNELQLQLDKLNSLSTKLKEINNLTDQFNKLDDLSKIADAMEILNKLSDSIKNISDSSSINKLSDLVSALEKFDLDKITTTIERINTLIDKYGIIADCGGIFDSINALKQYLAIIKGDGNVETAIEYANNLLMKLSDLQLAMNNYSVTIYEQLDKLKDSIIGSTKDLIYDLKIDLLSQYQTISDSLNKLKNQQDEMYDMLKAICQMLNEKED